MRGQMTHLDTDVLAEFRAGLITGRRGARITAHLGGCERCTALDEQLAGVRSLLASVPAPTMPDSVAQRLDTVLAAEVAQRNAAGRAAARGEAAPADQAERAGGDGTRESPAPRRPGGNRGFRLLALRVLAPAAAVVVLAAGGYGLTTHQSRLEHRVGRLFHGRRRGAGCRAERRGRGRVGRARQRARRGALQGSGVAAAGDRAAASRRGQPREPHPRRPRAAGQSRTARAAARLAAAARDDSAYAAACKLAGGHTLELVESVHFEGSPATLIVARTGAEDTAWIAAPDCSATHRDVLDTTTLPSGISGP